MMDGNRSQIEFFGPPGVGKTAAAREVVRLLMARGIPAACPSCALSEAKPLALRLRDLARTAGYALRERAVTLEAVRLADRFPQRTRVTNLRMRYNAIRVLRWLRADVGRDRLVVTDHGVLQLVWSLIYGNPKAAPADWPNAVGEAYRPRRIVHLHAPVDVLRQRLADRKLRHSRLQKQGGRDLDRLEEAVAITERILSDVEGWDVPILDVDAGGDDPEGIARMVVASIAREAVDLAVAEGPGIHAPVAEVKP